MEHERDSSYSQRWQDKFCKGYDLSQQQITASFDLHGAAEWKTQYQLELSMPGPPKTDQI